MCEKKPHPRCSSHASKALEKATLALEKGLNESSTDNELLTSLMKKKKEAEGEFNVTPKGLEALQKTLNEAKTSNQPKEIIRKHSLALNYYTRRRSNLIEAFNKIEKGEIRRCGNCGKELKLSQPKYCSTTCSKTDFSKNHKRTCKDCGRTPEETDFAKHPATFDGLSIVCKDCNRIRTKNKAANFTSEHKRNLAAKRHTDPYKNTTLLRTFGITIETYKSMLSNQANKCRICKNNFTEANTPHVDHDHSNGKVRGLLCRNCNWALGHFKDDPEILEKAKVYLANTKEPDPAMEALFLYPGEQRIDLRNMRHIRMSHEGRERLLVSQGSKCKICAKDLTGKRFNVDHSHSDFHVRGILCPSCNVGIGSLQETGSLFDSAKSYLVEFSS